MKIVLKAIGIILSIFFALGLWIWFEFRTRQSLAPSAMNISFNTYLAEKGDPKDLRIFRANGEVFVEVLGSLDGVNWLYVPSGPPAYVFNVNGMLVDWAPDRGDVPEKYLSRWGKFNVGRKATVVEVRNLFQAATDGNQ